MSDKTATIDGNTAAKFVSDLLQLLSNEPEVLMYLQEVDKVETVWVHDIGKRAGSFAEVNLIP